MSNGKKKEKKGKAPVLNNGNTAGRDEAGKFAAGNTIGVGNPGAQWHSTSVRRMFENLARASDQSPEELRDKLEAIGYDEAMQGKFPFWREIIHYIHGKPTETKDINIKGELSILSDSELEEELAGEVSEAIGALTGEEEETE